MSSVNPTIAGSAERNAPSPIRRILITVLISFAVLWLTTTIAKMFGASWSIRSSWMRTFLLINVFGSVAIMMIRDNRSAAENGLIVDRRWLWNGLFGVFVGGLVCFTFFTAACWSGAFHWQPTDISVKWSAMIAKRLFYGVVGATVVHIVFNGYLLSVLREQHGRVIAICTVSILFAGGFWLANGVQGWWHGIGLFVGLSLIMAIFAVLRLRLGSVVIPIGLMVGWTTTRYAMMRTPFVVFSENWQTIQWFAPFLDPRCGIAFWIMATIGLAACTTWLLWAGEYELPAGSTGVHSSFKRMVPFSNLKMLAPLDLWLRLLVDARFAVGIKYLPRLGVILIASTLNTIVSLPERFLLPLLLRKRRVPDPIFIVGVHRSGTTHLHNLLALDDQVVAPASYQVFNPSGFLFSGWIATLFFRVFLNWRRPMDAVPMHAFAPQEEEFAVAGLCKYSPYWSMTFPKRINQHNQNIFPDNLPARKRRCWAANYRLFLKKLTFWNNKKPLLKSPYNTVRVAALREMFPSAKFIHITRHPHTVYRSNMHLAKEGFAVFQLQDPNPNDNYQTRFLENYRDLETAYYRDAEKLPAQDVGEIRFENLETNPIGEIRRIYAELNIPFTERFESRLKNYLRGIANYQKNKFHPLPEETSKQIDAVMSTMMNRWGYSRVA